MKRNKSERPMIRTLRKAIEAGLRTRTIRGLATEADIPFPVLSRFLQHERGMSLESAAALVEALGMELRKADS